MIISKANLRPYLDAYIDGKLNLEETYKVLFVYIFLYIDISENTSDYKELIELFAYHLQDFRTAYVDLPVNIKHLKQCKERWSKTLSENEHNGISDIIDLTHLVFYILEHWGDVSKDTFELLANIANCVKFSNSEQQSEDFCKTLNSVLTK